LGKSTIIKFKIKLTKAIPKFIKFILWFKLIIKLEVKKNSKLLISNYLFLWYSKQKIW